MYRFGIVVVFALVACGGEVETVGDAGRDAEGDACAPSPPRYGCETDPSGREWWTLTEGCKVNRKPCDVSPNPACDLCRGDAGCWRCADRRWRNVCTREVGTDADSCANCGERCDGG